MNRKKKRAAGKTILYDSKNLPQNCQKIKVKGKGKVTLFNITSSFSYETGINGSRRRRPLPPLPLSVLHFTGIQSYGYTDQRKVEPDVRSLKIEPETSCSESRALAN